MSRIPRVAIARFDEPILDLLQRGRPAAPHLSSGGGAIGSHPNVQFHKVETNESKMESLRERAYISGSESLVPLSEPW
ncbi:MAG: hypothetical protein ACK4NC_02665 [Candidatus Gracilibacteria bacterium]